MYNSFEFSARLISGQKLIFSSLALTLAITASTPLVAQRTPADDEPGVATVDQLETEKSWQLKNDVQSLEAIESWVNESPALKKDALKNAIRAFTDFELGDTAGGSPHSADRLDRVIAAVASARPDIAEIANQLSGQRKSVLPPNFSHVLDNQNEHAFVRYHVRLLLGRWLAQNEFYDETVAQLNLVDAEAVLTPESVLFYRALAEHQLLQKDDCKATVEKLLEHEVDLPVRFAVVAKMMLADLSPVEEGSLDEISRLMKDIYRRTQFQRSGTLVLKQEADVIDKLDKLIEDLEEQRQQQQANSSADGAQPSGTPMEESQQSETKGDGKVTAKDLADGGQWGDMAPAERSAAMAEMVKDMPPHYRAAIEKYFRRLAQEDNQ